jgi:hypothetical protein
MEMMKMSASAVWWRRCGEDEGVSFSSSCWDDVVVLVEIKI